MSLIAESSLPNASSSPWYNFFVFRFARPMRYPRSPRHRLRPAATHPDVMLVTALAVLCGFGFFALASASSIASLERYGNPYHVVARQLLVGGVPGAALFAIFQAVDYRRWQRYRWWWLALTLALLAAVFAPGIGQVRHGAQSWLGLGPITFQPAEVVKLTAVLYLAAWLAGAGYHGVQRFRHGFAPFVVFAGLTLGLIALQPDLGTLLVVAVILATTYFAAGAKLTHLGALAVMAAAGAVAVLPRGGYRWQRIVVFLHPNFDPQGAGYHITQAYLAIGAGGWFGRGLGKSHQKFSYLPEVSADSIFAIIAEELGFIAAAGLVLLLALVVLRALRIAKFAPDPFGRFLAVGIAAWFGFQSFLNIAAMVGIAPLTGLPLPFVSAGGTALAANLAAAGLLLNISRHTTTS